MQCHRDELISHARELRAVLMQMRHRDLDGKPCWCMLWPDEQELETMRNIFQVEGHGDHCIAANAAFSARRK